MTETLKQRSLKGVFWAVSESVGTVVLSLGSFLVLARLLDPVDFGAVALAGSFIMLFNLITGHSFADALIQERSLDDDHAHTAFWATLAIAVALALACGLGSGSIARLLGAPIIAPLLAVLALVMPLNAMGSVQGALLRRELRFRELAKAMLAGRATGAAIGITLAFMGAGAWSLVGQQIGGTLVANLAIALTYRWRPRLRFSAARFRRLGTFGAQVSVSQVLLGAGEQAVNLMVGVLFGPLVLGYFNIAWRTVQLIRSLFSSALYHVGFSTFSRLQDDRRALAEGFIRATRLSALVGVPLGVGLALAAEPFLLVLYGEKWAASVPILSWLALQFVPAFFGMFFAACYRATGRADWVLYLTIGDLIVSVAGVWLLGLGGQPIHAVAIFWVAKSLALIPIHILLLRRLLGTGGLWLLRPALAPLGASLIMAAGLFAFERWLGGALGAGPLLGIEVVLGVGLYWLAIRVTAPALQRFALSTFRSMAGAR